MKKWVSVPFFPLIGSTRMICTMFASTKFDVLRAHQRKISALPLLRQRARVIDMFREKTILLSCFFWQRHNWSERDTTKIDINRIKKSEQQQQNDGEKKKKRQNKWTEESGILHFDLTWHLFIIIYFPVNWLKWKKWNDFFSRHTIQIVKYTKHVEPSFSPRTAYKQGSAWLCTYIFRLRSRDIWELVAHRKFALFSRVIFFDTSLTWCAECTLLFGMHCPRQRFVFLFCEYSFHLHMTWQRSINIEFDSECSMIQMGRDSSKDYTLIEELICSSSLPVDWELLIF